MPGNKKCCSPREFAGAPMPFIGSYMCWGSKTSRGGTVRLINLVQVGDNPSREKKRLRVCVPAGGTGAVSDGSI